MNATRLAATWSRWIGFGALACLCAGAQGTLQAQQAAAQPIQPGAENIRGIVVVSKLEDVNTAGVSGIKGVVVKGPDFLRRPDFEKLLSQHLGSALTETSLAAMQTNVIRYCRARGHLVVDVFYREQDIVEGTIQVAVLEGKVGKITVANEGRKWFSDSLILREVSLKPGDVVIEKKLDADLNWLNRNAYQSLGYFDDSFRDVTASFKQGQLGETDVQLTVDDRCPVRLFGGIENSGIQAIGENRLFAGVNLADFFRLDHRLNFEYITDTSFERLKEGILSYTIPLPWKHEFSVFGAYANLFPDMSVYKGDIGQFRNDGTFWQVSGRYSIPLPAIRDYEHEFAVGFDFKRTDSPLLFVGAGLPGLLRTNSIDVAQFVASYSGRLRDTWGGTAFSLQGFYSPGELSVHNNQAQYSEFAPGTDPDYFYGRLELRRETLLPARFSWFTRAVGQMSDAKLVATEVFTLGGYDTVRGYDERIVSGDQGWLLSNELRTPRMPLGNITHQKDAVDWIQGLVFFDYGGVYTRNMQPLQRYNEILASVGLGLRFQVADNLRVRFDYGWQLAHEYQTNPSVELLKHVSDNRAHFGLELSF
jgi:hemolysin activation/secretion protein